jgi:hypothetical protein
MGRYRWSPIYLRRARQGARVAPDLYPPAPLSRHHRATTIAPFDPIPPSERLPASHGISELKAASPLFCARKLFRFPLALPILQ